MAVGISTERQGELLREVFKILAAHPDGLPGREVLVLMQENVPPTEYEAGFYKSNAKENRGAVATRFWTVNCVKAGWMEKSASGWRITDEGRSAFEKYTDPGDFARASAKRLEEWKSQQGDTALDVDLENSETSAAQASVTVESAREDAWSQIEAYLAEIDPYDFQQLVAGLLTALGCHVAWVSPPGPDQGLDILAYSDPLGVTGTRIKVQVKRQPKTKMTVDDVKAFLANLGPSDVGIFVSTGGFTSEAEKVARAQEVRRISLIDQENLVDLYVSHLGAVPEGARRLLPLTPVWFLAPPGAV